MPLLLVVEDNDLNADMLIRRLKRAGFDTAWAKNGMQAVELVDSLRPAVVLMDLSLPVMDGFETTRTIKTGNRYCPPIIALTAHALFEDQQKALEAGFDEYETKPINFPQLLRKINLYIGDQHDVPK